MAGIIKNIWWLVVLWLSMVWLMYQSYLKDPYNPEVPLEFGHNGPGDLTVALIMSAIELLVLCAIFAIPNEKMRPSWSKSVVALSIFFPWMVLSMCGSMHVGGIMVGHNVWLLAVNSILFAQGLLGIVRERHGSDNHISLKLDD